jgi:hypothetical protein
MLTELDITPIPSGHSRQEARKSIAGGFAPIDKQTAAQKCKRKDLPPQFHPTILLGSQYAARANSIYGENPAI